MKQLLDCTRNFLVALFPEEGDVNWTASRYRARLDARWTFFLVDLGKVRVVTRRRAG